MDNTYLCRGKRVDNGEWVTGYYFHDPIENYCYIFTQDEECSKTEWAYYRIDPSVTGQCTGLKDKKGNLIFEHDICKFEYCNNHYKGKIVYNHKTCALEMWNEIVVGAYGEKATNTRLLCHCENIEVVGTIHDIPKEAANES